MFYIKLLSIVVAVSLDGFGVGMTYGMRKIRIPFSGFIIIVSCSGLIVLLSMTVGQLISTIIPPAITSKIGSFILIGLGCFVFLSVLRQKYAHTKSATKDSRLLQRLTSILEDPTKADNDASGNISISEATILGFALALDAFAAGFGAAMLGYSPFITAFFIACMSGLFLYGGVTLGHLLVKSTMLAKLPYLPPVVLITIGVYNLF